jgi:GNAT superfamily N-acetyltransferase
MFMEIRAAIPKDAESICLVVRRSIIELCTADHRADPSILDRWLANKTPDNVLRWVADPNNAFLVATENDDVLSAGCVKSSGEIVLNYVSPDAQFRGISKAMLKSLESASKANGKLVSSLDSTLTALRFYTAAGYIRVGETVEKHGLIGYPMNKPL